MSFAPVATAPVDLESQTQVTTKQEQKSSWLGRKVSRFIPTSREAQQTGGGIGAGTVLLAGAIMWGVCAHHECAPGTLLAGQIMTGIGGGCIVLACCLICCIGALSKDK